MDEPWHACGEWMLGAGDLRDCLTVPLLVGLARQLFEGDRRGRDDAMAYLRSRTLFQGWTEEMLELYITHGMTRGDNGGLRLACSPQREAALFMGGRQFDPWPLLSKVSCPVLIVEGEKSGYRVPDCTAADVEVRMKAAAVEASSPIRSPISNSSSDWSACPKGA